ncbi:MAG TPA: nucleotidyl transferase AbiEii/AbiGii toxin family protein [archaeon]|nr:nucleotidyl transferase AbiEii/AbiGii toxin family protein [archaeon]
MDAKTLKSQSTKQSMPQGTLERDYVLSVVLKELANSDLNNRLVFKGGTAIKKIYFGQARFSEDLDFTATKSRDGLDGAHPSQRAEMQKQEEIEGKLRDMFENKTILGVSFSKLAREKTSAGLRLMAKFTSFLNHSQKIKFDISFRDNLVLKPVKREVIDSYSLGKSSVMVMELEEIFAEKTQALLSRTVARDLYDTWYLLKHNVKLDMGLVNKKFAFYNEQFDLGKLEEKIKGFEARWKQDLQQFLKNVPSYDDTVTETMEMLRHG